MRVCIFSLDKKANEIGSPVQRRLAALAAEVGEIEVITPNNAISKLPLFFRRRFDLISVQDTAYFALFAYVVARFFKVPFEVQVHGFEKFFGLRKMIAGFVLKRADKIRVVSERLRTSLTVDFGAPKKKIYVLPIYAQIPPLIPPFKKGGIERGFSFLTVGRLVPIKNISLQIRAFAKIAKEFPNARLHIVGSGQELNRLKLLTTNYSLQTKMFFVGEQKDVSQFYKNADAFLLSSDSEGWGIAVIEAAAHGL